MTAADLRFDADRGSAAYGTVGVHGLPAAALERLIAIDLDLAAGREVLSVRTAAAGEGLPFILGERSVVGGTLRFKPRFPFRAGLDYRARFDGAIFDRLTGAEPGTTLDLAVRCGILHT